MSLVPRRCPFCGHPFQDGAMCVVKPCNQKPFRALVAEALYPSPPQNDHAVPLVFKPDLTSLREARDIARSITPPKEEA